jgi:hypothetical protein
LGDVAFPLPEHDRADSRPMEPETPRASGPVSVTRQTTIPSRSTLRYAQS